MSFYDFVCTPGGRWLAASLLLFLLTVIVVTVLVELYMKYRTRRRRIVRIRPRRLLQPVKVQSDSFLDRYKEYRSELE
jgi:hypothetical protein